VKQRQLVYAIIFVLLSIVHICAVAVDAETIRFWTKPMLMPLLGLVYYEYAIQRTNKVIWALFFSFLGDVFLMGSGVSFFLGGLGFFLLAHLFYSYQLMVMQQWNLKGMLLALVLFGSYASVLMTVLYPTLDALLYPVFAYALIICFFGCLAFHAFYTAPKRGLSIFLGASIFILSDSMIAINTFYLDYEYFTTAVMTTYLVAQALIVYYFAREVVN